MGTANASRQHDAGNQPGGLDAPSRLSPGLPIFGFVSAAVCALALATLTLFCAKAGVGHTNTATPPARSVQRSADLPAVVATLLAACRSGAILTFSAIAPSTYCITLAAQATRHLRHANQSGYMAKRLSDMLSPLATVTRQRTRRQALRFRLHPIPEAVLSLVRAS